MKILVKTCVWQSEKNIPSIPGISSKGNEKRRRGKSTKILVKRFKLNGNSIGLLKSYEKIRNGKIIELDLYALLSTLLYCNYSDST